MNFKLTLKGIAIGGTTYTYKVKEVSLSNNKINWITEDDNIHSTWLRFVYSFTIGDK